MMAVAALLFAGTTHGQNLDTPQGPGPEGVSVQVARPRLVVGLVVDQMRWDYLYDYLTREDGYRYGPDGVSRLLREGFSYDNTMIPYVPTVTAIGHASIYTGTVPALHGIAGNNFYVDGRKTYCCEDPTVESVGSTSAEGRMSPRNLLASGLGDQIKLATHFKGKVIGVALKDRASILPAGHSADGAYWWDTSAGRFITSTYYMKELPEWVKRQNRILGTAPGTNVKMMPEGVTKTFDMARAAIEGEQLGQDGYTDLLAISISSTDAIGHELGTRAPETAEAYMALDRGVKSLLEYLDARVGRGQYLLFLSADHGAAHNHNYLSAHRVSAGGMQSWTWTDSVSAAVGRRMGLTGKVILAEDAGRIYLDHKLIRASGRSLDEVKQAVIGEMELRPEVIRVVDFDRALTTSIPQPLRERIVNGYHRGRSGDLFVIGKPNWENVSARGDYRGTTHGQWNPYDAHIPFVLYGWGVKGGHSDEPVYMTDIAQKVCAMMRIQMPNSSLPR